MILIPIGHEAGDTVRRLPWVTFSIIGLCLVALVTTAGFGVGSDADRELMEKAEEAVEYWVSHPYLELDPEFAEAIGFDDLNPFTDEGGEAVARGYEPPAAVRAVEQAELDSLVADAKEVVREHPFSRFGLTPSDLGPVTLITYMFLHAGWLHLIGNMLILYLAGPFIEDVWGRAVYGGFYAVSGIVAALSFVATAPDSNVPLVGASGAVAGVMGAFLVRYWQTRITFFYMFGLFVRGTFAAPAWLMLPLWFLEQLFMMMMMPDADAAGGGIAHAAHVGGFVCGAGIAFAIRRQRIEEHWLEPALARTVEARVVDNSAVDQALGAYELGDAEGAMSMLGDVVRRQPTNADAAVAYWQVALDCGRASEAVVPMARTIGQELARGATDDAVARWAEVAPHVDGSTRLDPGFCTRLAKACAEAGRIDDAVALLRHALLAAGSRLDPSQALAIARAARTHAPSIGTAALRLALRRPDLEPSLRARLEQSAAELTAART